MPKIVNASNRLAFRRELRANQTPAEATLWMHLKAKRFFGLKFKRQYGLGPFVLDFFCHEYNLAIEIDGGQHADNVVYDEQRSEYLKGHGIGVLRFWNNEVTDNLEGVLETIKTALSLPSP